MTNMQMILAGAGVALLTTGCILSPALRRKLITGIVRTAVECGPELIREVGGLLLRDDWREQLRTKAGAVGIDLVRCAVEANSRAPSIDPMPAGLPELGIGRSTTNGRIDPNALVKQHAADWLRENPQR